LSEEDEDEEVDGAAGADAAAEAGALDAGVDAGALSPLVDEPASLGGLEELPESLPLSLLEVDGLAFP
jgi:hypothetical protein